MADEGETGVEGAGAPEPKGVDERKAASPLEESGGGARGGRSLEWIGGRRFWLAAVAIAVAALLVLAIQRRRLSPPDALVPVVTVTGPSEARPGETVRYAVLVRDRFGAPIPNAQVRVGFARYGLTELGRGTTGEGGDVSIEVRLPEDFAEERSLVAVAEAGVASAMDGMTVGPRRPAKASVYVSTDKPLYQPGQTIHVRALAMAGEKPVADRAAVVEIRTEDGTKVFREEKPTSAFGVVATDFVLADQVKLGRYRIVVALAAPPGAETGSSSERTSGEREVDVKRYALPKLKVAFEDVSRLTPGEPLVGKVRATWLFGEPVTSGKVSVTVGDRSAEGRPDAEGVYRFELEPKRGVTTSPEPGGVFTLRAKVEVEGGTANEATMPLSMRRTASLALEAFPESGVLVPGHAQTVYVVPADGPSAGLSIQTAATGASAKVSDRGIAKIVVVPEAPAAGKPASPVKILAFAEDGAEGSVEVPVKSDALALGLERDSYDAGQSVRVNVLGASRGDRVALRMTKGAEPIALGGCVVGELGGGCSGELVIPEGASGLVWLHALSLPGDRRPVKTGKRLVIVGGGSRDLALKATPDRPAYAPRDRAAIDVAVTGAGGAPVEAQLGVAVVDEAVFALADVRPDLEKIFFTIDEDLARARGAPRHDAWHAGGRSYGASFASSGPRVPAGLEPSDAYQPAADADVRGAILAVLSTMSAAGGFEGATAHDLDSRADEAVDEAKGKLAGAAIVVMMLLSLAAFACFGACAAAHLRSPRSPSDEEREPASREALRRETRALWVDWLIAVLGPPLLAACAATASELFGGRARREGVAGTWAVLATFFVLVLLVRAVLRVRRVLSAPAMSALRRALVFLPVAAFFAHASLVFVLNDEAARLRSLFDYDKDALGLPLLVVLAAQLATGLLSLVRGALLRPVTRRQGAWLLLSRASFLGLPVTMGLCVVLVVAHVKARRTSWAEGMEGALDDEPAAASADNKEGGTGVRAKGEEGSMGKANAPRDRASSSRPLVVRDFFPETLLWAPDVVTDGAGRARIEVPLADSITTWRFGLTAVGRAGQLGSATLPLVVKQDFFVDATLPPTLTQGDEIAMPVTVFGYTDADQDVALELEGDGISAVGPARVALHLAPRSVRGHRFVVRADKAGDRMLRVKATSATRADAIERKLVVVPNGLAVTRVVNARVVGSTSLTAELPARAIDGGNDLHVKIYGGPLSQVSEGLDGVFRMPHGCFEQTSSTTYPSILALDFLRRTKTVSPDVEKRARAYISQGFQRLVTFEVPGGGFSLFGHAPASTTLTAYGLMEFADLSEHVSYVDDALLRRTRDWLYSKRSPSGGWPKPGSDPAAGTPPDDVATTAYVAWAVARASRPTSVDRSLSSVLDVVEKASGPEADEPYALALRANALVAGGRTAQAKPLLERLAAAAVRDDDGVHWTSKAVGVMYSYASSMDVEVTGLATYALAQAGLSPELRDGALSWLASRRGPHGTWSTTQATIAAMRALLAEAAPTPKESQDVKLVVDGVEVAVVRLEPGARDVHRLVGLRTSATTGTHTVEVRATGSADVSCQLVATHYLPWQRQPGASPLALDVAYAPATLPAGSVTSARVRLAWSGSEPARMPLVEIAVPPAFEAETADLDKLVARPDGRVRRYTVERGKVTLYLVDLPAAEPLTIDLPLRALRPARVVAPSSTAWLYYEPEVRAETPPVVVRAM